MTPAEAHAAAAAEGLKLLRSENATGFKSVCRDKRNNREDKFKANLWHGGRMKSLLPELEVKVEVKEEAPEGEA